MSDPSGTVLAGSVTLRPVAVADAGALADAVSRQRAYLAPWEPLRPAAFFTAAGQRVALAAAVAEAAAGRSLGWLLWDGQRVVGRINLSDMVRGAFQNGHLGYWVAQDYQGRGLATAAVGHVTALAFDTLGLHRVQAGTLVHNAGSQAVLMRAGFTRIGTAERYLRINGQWQDHVLFQRLTPAPD